MPLRTRDIIGWDVKNWSRALSYWEHHLPKSQRLKCLEIGANQGGISLWLASLGHDVICSDVRPALEEVKQSHKSFGVRGNISYEAIDALDIPYKEHFDVIVLKSVLGGVSGRGKKEKLYQTMTEIQKALKPDGVFLFAENLIGTKLHVWLRGRLRKWERNNWNYLHVGEMDNILKGFKDHEFKTTGFLGVFGYYEPVRNIFGTFDGMLNRLPANWHYIVYGYAKK